MVLWSHRGIDQYLTRDRLAMEHELSWRLRGGYFSRNIAACKKPAKAIPFPCV